MFKNRKNMVSQHLISLGKTFLGLFVFLCGLLTAGGGGGGRA